MTGDSVDEMKGVLCGRLGVGEEVVGDEGFGKGGENTACGGLTRVLRIIL